MSDINVFIEKLKKINTNTVKVPFPQIESSKFITYPNKTEQFIKISENSAVKVISISKSSFLVEDVIKNNFVEHSNILNIYNTPAENLKEAKDYNKVDVVVLKGEFGVAENAAIWIKQPNDLDYRSSYFLSKSMLLVLEEKDIVNNMFEAYNKISFNSNNMFGVFVAGPSRTADIEQVLVIGAHGPKNLVVALLKD